MGSEYGIELWQEQGAQPLEAGVLCPGPPDLWCSPDPFQPET